MTEKKDFMGIKFRKKYYKKILLYKVFKNYNIFLNDK